MVFYNRRDDLISNINEMLYLEKWHLSDNKIDYPFELDNKLCLANSKAEDKDLVDKMLKLLLTGLENEAKYLKKEVMTIAEYKIDGVKVDTEKYCYTSHLIYHQLLYKGCGTIDDFESLTT